MYAYIRGKLAMATPLAVIVETGGIGYMISVPVSLHSQLPMPGENILLYISFVVREQAHTLYGFLSEQERDVFEVLMGVSGIGPKTALSLIGHLSSHNLYEAISNSDIPTICKVPGIGRKTAERLIIEMRDKLPSLFDIKPSQFAVDVKRDPRMQAIQDAMSALINLGYNQATAQKAIKKTLQDMPEKIELAELITHTLKNI